MDKMILLQISTTIVLALCMLIGLTACWIGLDEEPYLVFLGSLVCATTAVAYAVML